MEKKGKILGFFYSLKMPKRGAKVPQEWYWMESLIPELTTIKIPKELPRLPKKKKRRPKMFKVLPRIPQAPFAEDSDDDFVFTRRFDWTPYLR